MVPRTNRSRDLVTAYRDIDELPDTIFKSLGSHKVDLTVEMRSFENGIPYTSSVQPASYNITQSKIGQRLPQWRKLIASGLDATTPFSATKQKFNPGFVSATVNLTIAGTPYRVEAKGPSNHNFVDMGLVHDDPEQKARIMFYKRLRSELHDMAGGAFLAELPKAFDLVRNPARAMQRAAENFIYSEGRRKPRRPPKPGSKRAKELAAGAGERWLEFAFGVKPLVADIEDGAKAIASLHGRKIQRRVTGFGEGGNASSWTVKRSMQASGILRPVYYDLVIEDSIVEQVLYRAGLKAELTLHTPADHLIRLGQKLGLSPGELLTTAYEVTPWSFLIDYFSTLGDVVNAVAVSTGDIVWINRTSRKTGSRATHGFIDVSGTTAAYSVGGWKVNGVVGSVLRSYASAHEVQRDIVSSVPIPRLELRNNLNPMKMLNVAALLAALGLR